MLKEGIRMSQTGGALGPALLRRCILKCAAYRGNTMRMGIMGIQPLTNVKQAPPVENESHPTVGICESQIASCFGFTKRGLERPNGN